MGEVFAAKIRGAEGFTKPVALKRIYPHLAGDPQHRQLFVREAKIVAQLSHPNIVQVIELGTEGDELFMAMEFVQGISLAELVTAHAEDKLPPAVVSVIACDLLEALAYAHDFSDPGAKIQGIVHADVSPHNVMLTREGRAKLCDFGVAKLLRSGSYEATRRGRWGKAAYMAPEQLAHDQLDARTDVYAIAITMIEAMSGQRPYTGNAVDLIRCVVNGERPSTVELAPHVPRSLADIVEMGAAVDPQVRYQTASAMRRAIGDVVGIAALDDARVWLRDRVRELAKPEPANDPDTQLSQLDEAPVAQAPTALLAGAPQDPGPAPRAEPTIIAVAPVAVASDVASRGTRVVSARTAGVAGAAVLFVAVFVAAGIALRGSDASSAQAPSAELLSSKVAAPASPDGPPADVTTVVPVNAPVNPAVEAPDGEPIDQPLQQTTQAVTVQSDATSRRTPTRRARETGRGPAATTPASLNLSSVPWAFITIDGKRLAKTTPLLDFELTPGRHVVELTTSSGRSQRLSLDVAPGQVIKRVVNIE